MILYVNGDSHAAGAQAVNDFAFANDDFSKVALGRKPHPDNLNASWGFHLSKMLNLALVCNAESGCSNERILRTTKEFINSNNANRSMVVIGWTNWTRTEWVDEETNELIQINASFPESASKNMQRRFKEYVAKLSSEEKQIEWHNKIYQLHLELRQKNISHLFFNSNDNLNHVPDNLRKNWNNLFIDPYDPKKSYIESCLTAGYKHNEWYHFKQDAHVFWANYLFKWLTDNKISV